MMILEFFCNEDYFIVFNKRHFKIIYNNPLHPCDFLAFSNADFGNFINPTFGFSVLDLSIIL